MNVRDNLVPLEPLNLRKYCTVGELVDGMSKCSFGARMLGEVAATLTHLAGSKSAPLIIYDGKPGSPLGQLLAKMVERKWCRGIVFPEEYAEMPSGGTILVVGGFSERSENAIFEKPDRAIFVNQYGIAKPGQVRDGFFPDAVFADPRFVMPVLFQTLSERLERERKNPVYLFLPELRRYGGLAEEVLRGADVFFSMVKDKKCTVFLTLSGAMTIAQMSLVVCDMIETKMVHYISATGALMAHGLIENVGLKHYKYNPHDGDELLAKEKINRVTDTLEPEENFDHIEEVLAGAFEKLDGSKPISPRIFHEMIGAYISERYPKERGILRSAYEHKVPVLVPAFIDSEIGNDVYIENRRRESEIKRSILMNLELDTRYLIEIATSAEKIGIFTVGGGVPRNNTQNVAPLVELLNVRLGKNLKEPKFCYGCRIAPDEMHYGHLSGCTYSEGVSWRKMDPLGKFAEVHTDATLVWPFFVKAALETCC